MDWNLGQQQDTGLIQQPDKYETDSDNESDEKKLARKLAMRYDNLTGGSKSALSNHSLQRFAPP